MPGPADSKSFPGFDNRPRFVGVIDQNKISNYYENYCIIFVFNPTFDGIKLYSSGNKFVIFCFALLLPQILDNYQNQGQF